MKKIVSFLLALTLCAGLGVPTLAAAGFSDVADSSPFAPAIAWAVEKGVTKGTTPTTFGPENTCTASHILTFLWRAAGRPGDTGNEGAAVSAWASGLGIDVSGLSAPCTRAAAVTDIWRAQGCPAAKEAASFADVSPSAPYAPAVSWAVEAGVTNGTGDGAFSPEAVCTRGQIVTFLYRALAGGAAKKPETSAAGSGTLANGKPITEENVLAIIQELLVKYPNGMKWDDNTYRDGQASNALLQIAMSYKVQKKGVIYPYGSVQGGCGGFASLVSDSIFGKGDAAPARKVPFEQVRPGDVLILCDKDGNQTHFTTAASRITGTESYDFDSPSIASAGDMPGGMNYLYLVTTYGGNESAHVRYGLNELTASPQPAYPYYYEVWTRYPTDNATPWTGSSGGSGNTGTSTTTPGSKLTFQELMDAPCGLCGRPCPPDGSGVIWSDDLTRKVCDDCYYNTSYEAARAYLGFDD